MHNIKLNASERFTKGRISMNIALRVTGQITDNGVGNVPNDHVMMHFEVRITPCALTFFCVQRGYSYHVRDTGVTLYEDS